MNSGAASSSSSSGDVPPSFICPLTLEVMKDPVTAADGHSYEAEAIGKWLRSSNLSPLTGQELPHRDLMRSHALRNAIEEHHRAQKARERAEQASSPATPGAKVILLGDSHVGKTSLVHRIKEGTFVASQPTIGCSFCTHTVALPNGKRHHLAIWDTAGQEKYRAFTRQYFRGAQAAVVLYDITSAESLAGARRWLDELHAELPRSPATALVLAGSKLDLASAGERAVDIATARALATEASALHLECSAKDGTNVTLLFESVARLLAERGAGGAGSGPTLSLRAEAISCGRHRKHDGPCACQ